MIMVIDILIAILTAGVAKLTYTLLVLAATKLGFIAATATI